jgi:hypothetical protein
MIRLATAIAAVFLTLLAPATEPEVLGEGVTAQDLIPVKALLIDPDRHLGKTVVVDGTVTAMETGDIRRITIADPDGARAILFELPADGFRIPDDILGRRIVAEGLFEQFEPEPGRVGYIIRGTGAILR